MACRPSYFPLVALYSSGPHLLSPITGNQLRPRQRVTLSVSQLESLASILSEGEPLFACSLHEQCSDLKLLHPKAESGFCAR